ESVSLDAGDGERRAALAKFLTSPANPYFARAHVNRIWTCLVGWGFYPGVADLDTARPRYPEALEALTRDWVRSGYDERWLFRSRAIPAPQAYQRPLQPPPARGKAAAPGVCPQRLRPEQLFEALLHALAFDENDKKIPAPAPSSAPAAKRHVGLRHMVYHTFK